MAIAPLLAALALVDVQSLANPQTMPPDTIVATPAEPQVLPSSLGDPVSEIENRAPIEQINSQAGDITVTGRRCDKSDPLASVNIESYKVVTAVDDKVVAPVALGYKKTIPSPVRSGIRNFLSNLNEPVVALNYLLQLKLGKSAETVGRFVVNTTAGGAGLFDVARKKPFNLPRRTNGFSNTLGFYGVKTGAYLYLPFIGPTTVRDLGGRLLDLSLVPTIIGEPLNKWEYALPTTAVRLLDERAEANSEIRAVRDGASDPYTTTRREYLNRRQAEIDALRGRTP